MSKHYILLMLPTSRFIVCVCVCVYSLTAGTMTQCRELEGVHHEKATAIATQLLERFSRNQLEEGECPDQLRAVSATLVHLHPPPPALPPPFPLQLLVDKDAFMGSISTSHDLHLLAIDNKVGGAVPHTGGRGSVSAVAHPMQEDTILQLLKKDTTDFVNQLAEEEVQRNRGRVLEIMRYIGNEQEEMEMMEENYTTEN